MIYLVGNPGTGKSELLKAVPKIRFRTAYTDAPSASVRGLTYGQDEYKGHKILKAGLMVNHDGLCLDEFDKMGDSRQELNTTLEQQQASYHRNPFDIDTPINLFVIAAGNPKNSKWVEGRTLLEQLSPIEPEILSRFFIIKVNPAKNRSERLRHIFKNIKDDEAVKPKYTENDVAGWIAYTRAKNPQLTAEAEHEIIQFAEFFAGLEQPEEVNIDFGARQELDIIRVSSAIAKFLDKKSVDVECVRLAIKFIKDCMQSLGLRTESPNIQSDLYGNPTKPSDTFDRIVKELQKKSEDGCFTEAELLSEMVKTPHWQTNESAHAYWNRHNPNTTKSSQFYEPKTGRYKRV
jgi:replicative DNA helicase Mcm